MRIPFTIQIESVANGIDGLDHNKTFQVTEMAAFQSLMFAVKAKTLVPDIPVHLGVFGVCLWVTEHHQAAFESLQFERVGAVEQLIKELLKCVEFVTPSGDVTPLIAGNYPQIQEVSTFLTLFNAIAEAHAVE